MSTDDPIEDMIDRSSLGSAGARQLRSRTGRAELQRIRILRTVAKIRDRNQSGDQDGALQRARDLAMSGSPEGIVALAEAWREHRPESAGELYLEAARIEEVNDNLDEAEHNYENAAACSETSAVRIPFANFLLRHGNLTKASQLLDTFPPVSHPELARYAASYRMLSQPERFELRRWLPLREFDEMSELAAVMQELLSISSLLRAYRNGLVHGGTGDALSREADLWRQVAAHHPGSQYPRVAALHEAALDLAEDASAVAGSNEPDVSRLAAILTFADELSDIARDAIQSALRSAMDSIFLRARGSALPLKTQDTWAGPRQLEDALSADNVGTVIASRTKEGQRGDPGVFYRSLEDSCTRIFDAAQYMVGADLREIEIAGIPLEGVRWSTSTRWPVAWQQAVAEQSVEIGHGLFEINPDGRLHVVKVS
ncbi:MAG TPA: hypothetical protein VGL36_35710 [Kribbella sp.]